MKKYIGSSVLTLIFVGMMFVPNAHAEINTAASMLEQIKTLMAKVAELQKQLTVIQGAVDEVIKAGLAEGTKDTDVIKIQELLATDASIYPEGKITGFFGPLTREAVKRFQKRHELEITGTVDNDTKNLIEEYLAERMGGKIPYGLLRTPGIGEKVELKFKKECENSVSGKGLFCNKLKIKYKSKDNKTELEIEDEDENEDHDDEDEDHDEGDDN